MMLYSGKKRMNDRREPTSDEYSLERLTFHLETGDYFPMLATILGFLEETIIEREHSSVSELISMETLVIRNVRKDLDYLHKNYRIIPNSD